MENDFRELIDIVEPNSDGMLFEMAGLRQNRTGLPVYVWVSTKAGAHHDIRIKVSPTFKYNPEEEAVVQLRPVFDVIHGELRNKNIERLFRQWVALNMETLVAFWDEEIDQDEMLERVVRV